MSGHRLESYKYICVFSLSVYSKLNYMHNYCCDWYFSGMLHTGFDAPLDSLELQCIQHCQSKIFNILEKFDVPFEKTGAHVVAWTSEEVI